MFTKIQIPEDSPLWDSLIIISSLVVGFIIFVSLSAGYESVFPHILDIPIILFAYRYPRRGIWFAAFVSTLYLISYEVIISPVLSVISPAFGRVVIFMVIGGTVSLLSYRLRNSENTYRNLFDNLSNAAYSVQINPDGTPGQIMDVNEMMCKAVGYSRDELLAMDLAYIVPDTYIRELQARAEGLKLDTYGEFESFHIAKYGKNIPVEVKVHLFEIEAGPIILATATDMTERYHRDRISKAQCDVAVSLNYARDSEEAVRLVIGFALEISSLDAGAYYQAEDDRSSFSSLYSTGFSDVFLRKNETIQLPPEEITANRGLRPVYGSAENLIREGFISSTGENQKMIAILPVVGNSRLLGIFLLSSSGTDDIPDTQRRLIEAIAAEAGVAIDRLNAVCAQQRNKQALRSLVDSLDAYQALANPDETIITANRSFAAASGMSPEDIRGKNLIEFIQRSGEFRTFMRDSFAEVVETGHPVRFEDESEDHFLDTILYPVLGAEGSVRAVGMLSNDISPLREAKIALLETERKYRVVIEALNIGVFDLAVPENIMTVSPEWYTMLGYDGDMPDNVYSFWVEHLHPDERETVLNKTKETTETGDEYYNEYRMLAADGTWRWIKSHGKVIRWLPDGSPSHIIGTHSEITRRKHAERVLERTGRLLRDAQRIAGLGYYEYNVDNDLILPDAGLYEILNIHDEEPAFTFHEFCGFIHPDERGRIEAEIRAAARENRSYSQIFRIIARGGPVLWVRAWIGPGSPEDGMFSSVFGAMQDITDVRQTEEELLRTQIAVETSPDEVLYIAPDGKVLYGNEQAVNVYGNGGAITGCMIGAIDPAYATGGWQQHWETLRTNTFLVYESRHRNCDGTLFPVEVVENYVKIGEREFSCVYSRNITARRNAENDLRESEQRFSLAVTGADLGIWDWDLISDHVIYDARFADIPGLSPTGGDIEKFSEILSLIHPFDRVVFQKNLDDYIAHNGAPFLSEFRIMHTDANWRWVRARGVIVSEDASGSARRMIGSIMDITKQHEAMDALAEQEEQLRETRDIARVCGWTNMIAENQLVFDRDSPKILGFEDFVMPQTMNEFFQTFIYPEDRVDVEEAYSRHLGECQPFDIVCRAQLPEGRIRYLHARCQTIFDNQGIPQKSVGIIQDVTAMKEAENELREREWKVNEAQRVTHIRFWECDRSHMGHSQTGRGTPLRQLSFLEHEGLYVHPDDRDWLAARFGESIDTHTEFSEEFRGIQEESEEVIYIFGRGSHYYHPDGSYLHSLGTIVDITERIQTMNALRESEKKFRLVAENPSIATYILQDYKFVYVNDTCVRLFGSSLEMMIGMQGGAILAPEMRHKMYDLYQECILGERSEIHLETQGITQTGVPFPFEIFGSAGEYGGRPALIGTIIDITERKAYEEMLTLTRLTVDQATIGISWVNRTGECIYINAKGVEMLRITADAIIGMNIQKIHPSLSPDRWEKFWEVLCSGGNQRFETIQQRGDSTSFPADILVDHVHFGDMEFACIFVTDISRRSEAETALQQSLAEKTTLLQEVHHRVKNNLALISSMIQMQMRTMDDERAAASLTETANRIISMALVHESIYRSRNLATIDAHLHLTALVQEIVPNLSVGKDIAVVVDAPGCTLDLDSGILYSLIVNELVTNSIKYAFCGRDSGKITITMKCSDEKKVLCISDDGVGIPEDVDPFRRPSLGMNIVHSVVTDQLGGTIERVRGEGTTWVLKFPVEDE